MRSLSEQRCFNHGTREAAARCLECGRFFCRECITEHDDRIVCAACLKNLARVPLIRRSGFVGALRCVQVCFGLLLAWFFFHFLGETLLSIPSSFHDGTIWKPEWDQGP
jgi:B-box zinc finger